MIKLFQENRKAIILGVAYPLKQYIVHMTIPLSIIGFSIIK